LPFWTGAVPLRKSRSAQLVALPWICSRSTVALGFRLSMRLTKPRSWSGLLVKVSSRGGPPQSSSPSTVRMWPGPRQAETPIGSEQPTSLRRPTATAVDPTEWRRSSPVKPWKTETMAVLWVGPSSRALSTRTAVMAKASEVGEVDISKGGSPQVPALKAHGSGLV
jgi:hypothetical protein